MWIILGNQQSIIQIIALLLLLVAAVVLNIGKSSVSVDVDYSTYHIGVLVVLAASLLSGISAALVQKAFLPPNPCNSMLFSAELAVYGIMFLVAREVYVSIESGSSGDLLKNWDAFTLIPVLTNACGGLIVGFVSKYAGAVVKGFALIAG